VERGGDEGHLKGPAEDDCRLFLPWKFVKKGKKKSVLKGPGVASTM
jgi:hypothetical protein